MNELIPYGCQSIDDTDVEAVVQVLRSDWLTQGPMVPRFEQAVAARCGASHAVAANSGTSALHLACAALELGPGDLLWTVPNTFVASANCARYCGADVDFVDIDALTYNMSIPALEEKLADAHRRGRLPKAVVPVHFAGQPCDMLAIGELAKRYRFRVIEDASHALGATYADDPVGSCRHSDVAVFSFHPVKSITTGEGGMCTTNDSAVAARMRRLASHGIVREKEQLLARAGGAWYYEQHELGFNYRMTDLQAALGISQLARLSDFIAARAAIAARYPSMLDGLPVTLPHLVGGRSSAWHLYVIRVANEALRAELFARLREAAIGVQVHYLPVHLHPYYRRLGFTDGDYPVAEEHARSCLSIPIYPRLSEAQQGRVADAIAAAIGPASDM